MNVIILDDYQDAVRKLPCAALMEPLHAKVFTNTVKGIGQLSVRLRDAEVLVPIRERTHFPRQLLEKLPKLKLIAQTGKVGAHIDVEACTKLGIAVAGGLESISLVQNAHKNTYRAVSRAARACNPSNWCSRLRRSASCCTALSSTSNSPAATR